MEILLVDADVILWCAKNDKLDALFSSKKIKIPKIILEQVPFVDTPADTLDLTKYIGDGSLEISDNPLTDDVIEILKAYEKCPDLAEIHPGEADCIAMLKENNDFKFCTGDIGTMKTLGFLRLGEQGISLEEIIGKVSNIRYDFTKECLSKCVKVGSSLWVQYGI